MESFLSKYFVLEWLALNADAAKTRTIELTYSNKSYCYDLTKDGIEVRYTFFEKLFYLLREKTQINFTIDEAENVLLKLMHDLMKGELGWCFHEVGDSTFVRPLDLYNVVVKVQVTQCHAKIIGFWQDFEKDYRYMFS